MDKIQVAVDAFKALLSAEAASKAADAAQPDASYYFDEDGERVAVGNAPKIAGGVYECAWNQACTLVEDQRRTMARKYAEAYAAAGDAEDALSDEEHAVFNRLCDEIEAR